MLAGLVAAAGLALVPAPAAAGPPLEPFAVTPAPPVELGPVRVGAVSAPTVLTLTAQRPVTITGVAIGGAFEIVEPLTPVLPHGATTGEALTTSIVVRPTAEEPVATQLVVTLSGGATFRVPLEGEGVVPRPTAADTLPMGTLCMSRPRTRPLVIDNIDGTGALAITGATSSNPAFTVAPHPPETFPVTVPAGGAAALDVTIAIADTRSETGTITVTTDVPGRTFTLDVTATGGLEDGYATQVAEIDFGAVPIGAAAPSARVTFRNCAGADRVVTDLVLDGPDDGDFLLSGVPEFPHALPAGDALELPIGFTPSRAGVEMARLTISHDGAGNPNVIELSGTGLADPGADGGPGDGGDDGGCCGAAPGPGATLAPLALVAVWLRRRRRR